jgi:putative protein kinase ArgK-like GTPase of G3E family
MPIENLMSGSFRLSRREGSQVLIPDHETEVDFLNCEAISRTVVDLLRENRARALTVGVHGDWGAGKSELGSEIIVEFCPKGGR